MHLKTFNDKPQWKNILAVILAIVGFVFLGMAWIYHLLVHFITMPKEKWIDFSDSEVWVRQKGYPNKFCECFCNIEASMVHQLYIFRVGFGEEYCKEDEI